MIGKGTDNVAANVVVRIGEGLDGILLSEFGLFGPKVLAYYFQNDKGCIAVAPILDGSYRAQFNRQNWGDFAFQRTREVNSYKKVWFGCYDTSNNGYCNNYEKKWEKCLDTFNIK